MHDTKRQKIEETMQKTPVSILQEMMVKKGTSPAYELVHNGGGTHENTFTYKVSCEGLSTTGTGRCKKDAKHTAAKNMLEAIAKHNGLLPLPASPMDSPVRTPLPKPMPKPHMLSPHEPFINAIGELQDICAEFELGDPKYETVSDTGPPHARVFTIKCTVSSFIEQGSSTTKKQAKHEAAKKMYSRIREIILNNNSSSDYFKSNSNEFDDSDNESEDILNNKLVKLIQAFPRKIKLGVKISEYHTKLRDDYKDSKHEIIESLNAFKKLIENNQIEGDELKDKFKDAIALLCVDIDIQVLPIPSTNNSNKNLIVTCLKTTPEITEVDICDESEHIESSIRKTIIKITDILLVLIKY